MYYNQKNFNGSITLKSSNVHCIEVLEKEIFLISSQYKLPSFKLKTVLRDNKSKNLVLFKSPFVFKKAKTSYLINSFKYVIKISSLNDRIFKLILERLKTYENVVEYSIKYN